MGEKHISVRIPKLVQPDLPFTAYETNLFVFHLRAYQRKGILPASGINRKPGVCGCKKGFYVRVIFHNLFPPLGLGFS